MNNKKIVSIVYIIFFSVLLFLPLNYFIEYYTHHLVFIAILIFTGLLCRHLYIISSIIVSLATIFIIHIEYNWGGGFVEDRIAVMLESPKYEIIEYLKVYLSYIDIALISYFVLLIIGIFILVKSSPKNSTDGLVI